MLKWPHSLLMILYKRITMTATIHNDHMNKAIRQRTLTELDRL